MDYTRPIETGLTGWLPPVTLEKQYEFPVRGYVPRALPFPSPFFYISNRAPFVVRSLTLPPPFYSLPPYFFSIDIGLLPSHRPNGCCYWPSPSKTPLALPQGPENF